MTVDSHLTYALRARNVARAAIGARTAEILHLVGLGPVHDRYPYELSGGQQQRVALARALASEPKVLLLDEPLSNLDAELRTQMRAELRRVHERTGLTTVLVTHDQAEALSLSDNVIVMHEGKIVDSGPPRDVYDRPARGATASFVGASNLLVGTAFDDVEGEEELRVDLGNGGEIRALPSFAIDAGTTVQLAIKPEDVRVAAAQSQKAGTNELVCHVTNVLYYGSHSLLTLSAIGGPGAELHAWAPKTDHFATGDAVLVVLPRERIVVFRHLAPNTQMSNKANPLSLKEDTDG
jgi:ABC-type Fe3+/spermidine/putrescine transport system ATPase subunit